MRCIEKVLERKTKASDIHILSYKYANHFLFPQSLLKVLMPIGGNLLPKLAFKAARDYPKACHEARLDVDHKLRNALTKWMN